MQLVVQLAHEMMLARASAVDTVDDGGHVGSFNRRGQDDVPSAGLDMTFEVLLPGERAGALQDNVHGQIAPRQLVQALLVQHDAGLATDAEAPVLHPHVTSVPAIHRVVLE